MYTVMQADQEPSQAHSNKNYYYLIVLLVSHKGLRVLSLFMMFMFPSIGPPLTSWRNLELASSAFDINEQNDLLAER